MERINTLRTAPPDLRAAALLAAGTILALEAASADPANAARSATARAEVHAVEERFAAHANATLPTHMAFDADALLAEARASLAATVPA